MMAPDGIGAMLRAMRESAGRTREEQALVLEEAQGGRWFDPENLKRWETERRLPIPARHELLARGYGVPVAEIVRAVAVSKRWRRLQRQAAGGQGEEGTAVDRRRFFGAAAVAATGAAAAAATGVVVLPGIAESRKGIDAALSDSDAGDLAYLNGAFERHRGGYRGRPPTFVLAQMRGDLDLLRDVLSRPHAAAARADLARTAAGITGLVAIIQHDRSEQRESHGWFATAEQAAGESGDRWMLAWVLARHAMVPLNYGAPMAAAALAVRARAVAGPTPSAAAALAAAVTARALASVGNDRGALAAVADARRIAERLDGTQSADTWFGYPLQKHHVHLSRAFTLMGRTEEAYAEQTAAFALTVGPSVITRALLEMDAAACLHADGDSAAAADRAVAVWQRLPQPYREGLVRSRAVALHHALGGTPHATLGEALSTT
ncbi:transcriptional regulator [Actinacidiphila sp. ITFR-21]|uniref:transcriptional regulator n=1 Tax=Actinacidiphila sp. ITFR-21 TaxID=3075199 RepID=UPI002889F791|nr:transcriptional regulator [Streptomyces sp. ITFR-21]WNI16352.1 transcriptional regulator [Streptomyces sp. ITFR-21]